MKEFMLLFFGPQSLAAWFAFILYGIIGAIVFSAIEVKLRDVNSAKTPKKFFASFFILDNLKRFGLTILLIFLQIRFWKELTGQDMVAYNALLMGFGMDTISMFGKKVSPILQADREKLLTRYSEVPNN